MGAHGQPTPFPGQALPAELPPGNFGVPPLGQLTALGDVDLGAVAGGEQPSLLDMGSLGVMSYYDSLGVPIPLT